MMGDELLRVKAIFIKYWMKGGLTLEDSYAKNSVRL